MTVLLLGDSHLDYIDPVRLAGLARDLGDEVVNDAVGGSCAPDLVGQVAGRDLTSYAAVVVSVGTNDASPWGPETRADFARDLTALVAGHPGVRWVYVASPGIEESRFDFFGGGANEELEAFSRAAAGVFSEAGGATVRTRDVLAPLGTAAFLDDGVHLTGAAYDVLLPAIADAARDVARR